MQTVFILMYLLYNTNILLFVKHRLETSVFHITNLSSADFDGKFIG